MSWLARLFARAEPTLSTAAPRDAASLAALHVASFNRGWSEHEFEQLLTDRNVIAARAATGRRNVGFTLSRRGPSASSSSCSRAARARITASAPGAGAHG